MSVPPAHFLNVKALRHLSEANYHIVLASYFMSWREVRFFFDSRAEPINEIT